MSEKLITQQAAPRPSALGAMAHRFNVEPAKLLETLKNTAFKGATDAQMMALCIVANEMGLNPFLREVYAFPDKNGGIVPVVAVDGWFNRINAHSQYDGMEKEFVTGADGKPFSCTVTIFRKDRSKPTKHTELYSECFRKTDPWMNQPHRMLSHRAIIQCARIAFGFAGADPEEAQWPQSPARGRVVEPFPLTNPEAVEEPPSPAAGGSAAPDAVATAACAASSQETPKGATPARRAAKAPPEILNLNTGPESAKEQLARRIQDSNLDRFKVQDWLDANALGDYDTLLEHECADILKNFLQLREASK